MGAHQRRRRKSRAWVDLSIRSKGLVVIAVPVIMLFGVAGAVIWFAHTDGRAQSGGARARQVMSQVSMLEGSLLDVQSGPGASATGAEPEAATVDGDVRTITGELTSLWILADQSAPERQAAAAVDTDAVALVGTLSRPAGDLPTAPGRDGTPPSTQADSNRLRADITRLDAIEDRALTADHGAITTANHDLVLAGLLALLCGLAGGVLAMRLFTDGVVARLHRLERANTALDDGRPVEDLPDGNDEIGRLAARFAHTTSELSARAEERDRARDQLENILTASPIVSLRYDARARRFTYASPNVEHLLGISAADALADPDAVAERFHGEDRRRLVDALESGAVRRGDRVTLTVRFRRADDALAWGEADAVCTPTVGPDGTTVGAVAFLVDVSERHLAQQAADERRFMLESIFHASPDTITVRDDQGRVVLASTSPADVMGIEGTDRASDRVSPEGRRLIDELVARCAADAEDVGPVVTSARASDGTTRLFETRARPVLDEFGTVTGTVTISRDITDRIRLEDSLRKASVAAERASEAKSEFLSRMSHELRTPLNAILGFAQLLELDALPEDQASSVDQIQLAGRHLLALINEVLDISRIEAGQFTVDTSPVDVDDVLLEVTGLLTPDAESAGVQLTTETAGADRLHVFADRQRLVQVLLNLGSNALKYGGAQSAVSFRTEPLDAESVRFEVTDTGPGIPLERQSELWVPFARLGAEHTPVEGTGVGLALSKHLVDLMGGAIGVRSRPGHGSTFWITLRRAEAAVEDSAPAVLANGGPATDGVLGAAAPHPQPAPAPHPAPHPHSAATLVVLQIEDNPSNASLVAQVLGRRPAVELLSAATAGAGLDLALKHRPGLVLLDLHLPDLPGDEVVRRLKAAAPLADTKIVVVSADATPSRIRRMLDLGVDGYLTKPVGVEALLHLVDRELEDAPS